MKKILESELGDAIDLFERGGLFGYRIEPQALLQRSQNVVPRGAADCVDEGKAELFAIRGVEAMQEIVLGAAQLVQPGAGLFSRGGGAYLGACAEIGMTTDERKLIFAARALDCRDHGIMQRANRREGAIWPG